jgi:alkanesulfonate monooxygenase SsuD/methylene tetrahydromethanopterin reductase-like flavin-dependent oxidoreductase (luciferase family)
MPRLGIRLHGGLTPQRCVELAVAAEAQGFASAWFAENPLERGALPALGGRPVEPPYGLEGDAPVALEARYQ